MPNSSAGVIAESTLPDGRTLVLRRAVADDAARMVAVMHAAFGARERIGAAPAALSETTATVAQWLLGGLGYVVTLDGRIVGALLTSHDGGSIELSRVCVDPSVQGLGIATFMVTGVLEYAASQGAPLVTVLARTEFPQLQTWWEQHCFRVTGAIKGHVKMTRILPAVALVPDADTMHRLGVALGHRVRPGDLLIASGELGAGKTTLAQGIGEGMGVQGPINSPTFVLARVHRSTTGGPALVHADAYRLGGFTELEDLDLEESVSDSVTFVEWGEGMAEPLASDPLHLDIRRSNNPEDETRWVFFEPTPDRWRRSELAAMVAEVEQ